ncbi:MAG: ATP-binding protein [Thermodesulfobacteriota bacterium]|nr:ATP-binding protein [Thermodesulfobacteriota bacterium]
MISRILKLPFGRKSFFLFGPRQTGKSTLVRHALQGREHAEVDLVLEMENALFAIEIKSVPMVRAGDLRGLQSFVEDYPEARPICISAADRPYMAGDIPVIPWQMSFKADYLDL